MLYYCPGLVTLTTFTTSSTTTTNMDILIDYRQRADFAQQEADKYKKLTNEYSLYRLLVFGLFIVVVCVAISVDEIYPISVAVIILIAAFNLLINKQNKY